MNQVEICWLLREYAKKIINSCSEEEFSQLVVELKSKLNHKRIKYVGHSRKE